MNKKTRMEVGAFPPEIMVNILSRLPVESILECKCICKAWETLIHDSFFLSTYTARHEYFSAGDGALGFCIMGQQRDLGCGSATVHYGEYRRGINNAAASECFKVSKPIKSPHKWFKEQEDTVASWNLIGSSNGLICLNACNCGDKEFTYTIYLYNPITKEYVNLGPETFAAPNRGSTFRVDNGYRAMGFGYHPITKEYKVIRINYKTRRSFGEVKVYTLGSSSGWRDKGKIPYVFTTLYTPGELVNGALHWLAKDLLTKDSKIVCFDLADEEFRNVPGPPCPAGLFRSLGTLEGCLCVYVDNDVWVLNEYMMDESWSNIFRRKSVYYPLKKKEYVVLRSCRSGVFVSNFMCETRKVISYNSESGSVSMVSDDIGWFKNYSRLDIVPYTKSFVSLKALGEKDVQYS